MILLVTLIIINSVVIINDKMAGSGYFENYPSDQIMYLALSIVRLVMTPYLIDMDIKCKLGSGQTTICLRQLQTSDLMQLTD